MEDWCALYTRPNAERQVTGALSERDVEFFLPTVKRRHRRRWQGWWQMADGRWPMAGGHYRP